LTRRLLCACLSRHTFGISSSFGLNPPVDLILDFEQSDPDWLVVSATVIFTSIVKTGNQLTGLALHLPAAAGPLQAPFRHRR